MNTQVQGHLESIKHSLIDAIPCAYENLPGDAQALLDCLEEIKTEADRAINLIKKELP